VYTGHYWNSFGNTVDLKRDAQTFLSIIESNKGIIYKVANSYCRDEENRKDLIQEIIVQLWLSFDKYDETYKLSTWMYRIALNVSISFYRKENRRGEINHPLPDTIIYLRDDPGESDNDVARLHQFIKELKEIDRAVIILYLEENNQQEIADILGLTVTNVSTKVSRIKQQLKQKFST
jgi:RNA polymerase sigma-70 factor (ECF subfamily)